MWCFQRAGSCQESIKTGGDLKICYGVPMIIKLVSYISSDQIGESAIISVFLCTKFLMKESGEIRGKIHRESITFPLV